MLTSGTHNSNIGSHSNDRSVPLEADIGVDPVSGGFYHADFKRHEDLKEMLNSNKDSLKLEAMKRIISMVAKGRDASVLFPSVVKNVVSKNIEVKKLIYLYLERYAEEKQDLALLSMSTFQRALKEPNQLIRAGALRVLSSIRVKMISPIVMLAIRDASCDMSPYVRKTAAHAIPKLYGLNNELKSELVTIIQKLLADTTVLVLGSAVMAFTAVCPERADLIHHVFRKFCALIVDVDEWGQVTIVNMLTRYARMQFIDPNLHERDYESDSPFLDSGSESSEKPVPSLDPDHSLLLRSTRPLLQSRNAAVVMAVAQLYHHASPKSERPLAAKAMVRLLGSHVEVQCVVLNSIASISARNMGMFEAYLRSFFIRTSDPTNVKLLKLEILTNLTTSGNVSVILRELQTYISHSDKKFVAATIQAIGRCACSVKEVTDLCLDGLVSLLSNRDEAVVAESVVVIKRLLQTQTVDPKEIITRMARLLDSITEAQARAAILWLLGEHSQTVPQIAPDILRRLAKTFSDEHDIVKLQVMNLAVKLYITNPDQTTLLCKYIFSLAKYDKNYDIRDKARLLKQFIPAQDGNVTHHAARIFLAAKPAPLLHSHFRNNEDLQLGSLSYFIKQRASGYEPLPPVPEQAPPGDMRNVDPIPGAEESNPHRKQDTKKDMFSWEFGSFREQSSGNSSESDTMESSGSTSGSRGGSKDESSSERDSDNDSSTVSESANANDENEDAFCIVEEEEHVRKHERGRKKSTEKQEKARKPEPSKPVSNLDLLLDLSSDVTACSVPVMMPSFQLLAPNTNFDISPSKIEVISPIFINTKSVEFLNKINGWGLSATYRFTRTPHIFSPFMTNVNIFFNNNTNDDISDIRVGKKSLGVDMDLHEFTNISKLVPSDCLSATIGIDFNETTQPANFEIVCSLGNFNVSIKPTIGELVRPVKMDAKTFAEKRAKLGGMNEHTGSAEGATNVRQKVIESANLGICENTGSEDLRFTGQTMKSSNLVLITIQNNETVTVNCENLVFGSVLFNELLHVLKA